MGGLPTRQNLKDDELAIAAVEDGSKRITETVLEIFGIAGLSEKTDAKAM